MSDAGPSSAPPARPKQVQLVGELPPAPRFAQSQIAEAKAGKPNGAADDEDEDDDEEEEAEGDGEESEHSDNDEEGEKAATIVPLEDDEEPEIPDAVLLDKYPPDETRIDLTHLRLTSKRLRKLDLPRFKETLEYLGLRQNAITKISEKDIGSLTKLQELDLYDNQLEKLGHSLEQCTELESLDLSFNNFKHCPHVSHLAKCHTLYFVQNKISRIRPHDFAPPLRMTLRSLELGGNRLRSMEHLEDLENLEELWLGKNKITKLECLEKMTKLRVLSIQSNRIVKIENLDKLVNLEEFYIAHNGLTQIEGLEQNVKLTTLDVAGNRLTKVENVKHLAQLEEFWANDNQIADINRLEEELGPKHLPQLNTVYLEGNPAQRKEGPAYRRKLALALPQIKQIDATLLRL